MRNKNMPLISVDTARIELNKAVKERRERILERFSQVAMSKVTDPMLIMVLEDVKKYWNDSRTHAVFRPGLTSLSCEAVGGNPEAAETAGLIFTLMGSGIGIHDDILDKSPQKHLRKTILGLHGVDSALLVGDLLIVKAWTMFHEMIRNADKPSRIADIMEMYGNLSVEICEAEFMETMCRQNLEIDLDYYTDFLWKAMAEMEACTKIGAIVGDGKKNEVEALGEFGRRLGFMSRLADDMEDCLDLKGDLLHRIKCESVPFPLLYAAKCSREKYLQIKRIVKKIHLTTWDATALLKFCSETEAFEYMRVIAKKNWVKATSMLRPLKPSDARNVLAAMNKMSYERIEKLCI
jgi:geranylgeranyl pyrophosphate synthase